MMTDVYNRMSMKVVGLVCSICCIGYAQTESREAQMLRAELSVFAQKMSPGGEGFLLRDLFEPCKRVGGLTNKLEAASLIKGFEDEILQLDISRMPYRDRDDRIEFIFNAAKLAARYLPDRGREYWAMRLRALTWAKEQIDRFGDDGPAKDPEMKARLEKDPWLKNRSQFINRKKDPTGKFDNWWHCFGYLRERLREFVGDAAYEIEWAQPELRGWVRGEIAKIVGHALTDDDFGPRKINVIEERAKREIARQDEEVRKPRDGGDVLPHPFTFLGCMFGQSYDLSDFGGNDTCEDVILCWFKNFSIDPYFGKKWMTLSLAPRSKMAYSAEISWSGQETREELFAFAKDIKIDIEKRLGVKLGEFFFEGRSHVCDEATWWKSDWGCARSRSVFGPILIELEAADKPRNFSPSRRFRLIITDTAAEALVERERKENPLKYDREAERRRFEQLKEMNRRRKLIPAKKPEK